MKEGGGGSDYVNGFNIFIRFYSDLIRFFLRFYHFYFVIFMLFSENK